MAYIINDVRKCLECGSDKTLINKNRLTPYPRWYRYKNGFLCHNCYMRLIINPKWNPINNKKQLSFKGTKLLLRDNPRTGICSQCGARKGIECKKTHIHHIRYHNDDLLKDTIELCVSCHIKESHRLGQIRGNIIGIKA